MPRISFKAAQQKLPPEWPAELGSSIRQDLDALRQTVVVFDDDPTGTQTVSGVAVLSEFSVPALQAELETGPPVFYILTNSRSLSASEARSLNLGIARNLAEAARLARREVAVVSRSDSTLRGHFPGEVKALMEGLAQGFDAVLLIPSFFSGGRFTLNDVHYVAEGDQLIPAAETEYARDSIFGYRSSNLRQWVEEKTGGRIRWQQVASISVEDLRVGGPQRVTSTLCGLCGGSICIVNAVSERDLEVFAAGLLKAERGGKRFLYRTAASFVPVRCGLPSRPLLSAADFDLDDSAGALTVAGSFVPRTSAQMHRLLEETDAAAIEVEVPALLDARRDGEIRRVAEAAARMLAGRRDVVIYTSRGLVTGSAVEDCVNISSRVSEGLVEIVRQVPLRPRYLLAKGGITASDLATRALGMKRAVVRGQILPGVPVWELGGETRFPGLTFVVFPGNVGDDQALVSVAAMLSSRDGGGRTGQSVAHLRVD